MDICQAAAQQVVTADKVGGETPTGQSHGCASPVQPSHYRAHVDLNVFRGWIHESTHVRSNIRQIAFAKKQTKEGHLQRELRSLTS